jgi:hypothetical protein
VRIGLGIRICAGIVVAGAQSVHAEDDFIASLRLRGGYDTNPQFSNGNGIGGSAFIGTDTALAAGAKEKDYSYGVAAEASTTQYANPLAVPGASREMSQSPRPSLVLPSGLVRTLNHSRTLLATSGCRRPSWVQSSRKATQRGSESLKKKCSDDFQARAWHRTAWNTAQ